MGRRGKNYWEGFQREMTYAMSTGADPDQVWSDIDREVDRKTSLARDDAKKRAWDYGRRGRKGR